MDLKFTGEYVVPDKTPYNIWQDHVERYKFACRFIKDDIRIVDVGCGTGYGTDMMAKYAERNLFNFFINAIDKNNDCIIYALENYYNEGVIFSTKDFNHYLVDYVFSCTYDLIVCFETIEHTSHTDNFLKNFYALLKDNGKLLLSTPNRLITSPNTSFNDRPRNPYHKHEFTLDELIEALNNSGFKIADNGIYGQRQRCVEQNKILRPEVEPLIQLMPRYYVIVAEKNND